MNEDFIAALKNFLNGWLHPGPKSPVCGRSIAIAPVGSSSLFFFPHHFIRIVATLFEIAGFDVADMEEPITSDAKIYKNCLDTRFQIDNFSFVDVSYVIILTGPLDVELLQLGIFHNRNSNLFGLRCVD